VLVKDTELNNNNKDMPQNLQPQICTNQITARASSKMIEYPPFRLQTKIEEEASIMTFPQQESNRHMSATIEKPTAAH
jgi:hypothetical protein